MLDPIALLQSLTLPAGAITGTRIVLDGTTGEIRFYSAANNLVLQLDGAQQLRFFQDIVGGGLVGAHQVDDLLMVDPGAVANTFEVLPTGSGVDVLLWGKSLPRGVKDVTEKTSDSTTSAGTELTILTGAAVTFDGVQRARIELHIRGISGTVAGDVFGVRVKEGATQLQETQWETQTINVAKRGADIVYVTPVAPTAGAHTYSATIQRVVGTGTATVQGAATRPVQLITDMVGGA
jgi:hypothetical protein